MTDEDNSTRQRLLNGMVTKLKTKLLCRKVFVSPCSSADMEFSKRDTSKKSLKFMESFKCDGTTQDNKIINFFFSWNTSQLYDRLAVILESRDKNGSIDRYRLCWSFNQC